MSYESQVDALLEELLESHRSVEEVCAEQPEWIDEVRRRYLKVRSIEAQIGDLFPDTDSTGQRSDARSAGQPTTLPELPGYEVHAILGHGGMGVVYQARHLKLNRPVAIKMLLAGAYASNMELLRFEREAESIAGLRHPHIVQIYDVGEVLGRPFYTMELVEGGTLSKKLADQPVSVREAAETLATLAIAVQAAHEGGIVHRDLKPANILLTRDGILKISDFGLARRVDLDAGLTMTGARMGTPSYMAPEQVSGGLVGPTVDIYALGTLLYEMLAGRPPFRGENVIETERRLISEEPLPPSRINQNVPPDLETICLKCLEKEPLQRYPTAAALADDLQRFLRYEPIAARPVGRTTRIWRWIHRSPTTAALIVTAVALCGMLAIYGMRELALVAGTRAEKARLMARLESGLELERQGRYAETRALLGKLGDGGHIDLRRRIDHAVANLDIVEALDALRLHRVSVIDGRYDEQFNQTFADGRYEALFSDLKIGSPGDVDSEVAARIDTSDFKRSLIAALDDWAVCASDPTRRDWLLRVACLADRDPTGLRDRIRDPSTWLDPPTLTELSQAALDAKLSVQLLRAIGDRIGDAGMDTIAFRKQVQLAHADDFLANFTLADDLREREPAEAVRYYQAALAIRPQASLAHNNLGMALAKLGRKPEAVAFFKAALRIDPKFVLAYYNLGLIFAAEGKTRESIEQFRNALMIDPNVAFAHYQLGRVTATEGDHLQAIESFRKATRIDPMYAAAFGAMGESFLAIERRDDAEHALKQCLQWLPAKDPMRARWEALLEQCGNS
ncbi:Serine/threonine-protein kinase PknB [Rosistilla carotiformis]|uniref:non-specific serine/threonine protein kinase n=1 Tax=Rosistilla carotiformis TaxID=2528017 RepID=A0A518JTT3_9BACT|nr:serine/threonine-protein kinase [Rosistilla carotiformis]QDV68964.1 Serine/threonine-protein kinase PknB [Rosistilla carotiformis]